MAALKLSVEQAEFMAKCLTDKVLQMMEEKGGAFAESTPQDVIDLWNEMAPLVVAIRELSEDQQTENIDLVRDAAREALSNTRESAGYELTIKRRIEDGEVVQWLGTDDKTAADAIARQERVVDQLAEEACLAWSAVEEINRVENEEKAANGDRRAKESLVAHDRWARENRKLAAEAVSA